MNSTSLLVSSPVWFDSYLAWGLTPATFCLLAGLALTLVAFAVHSRAAVAWIRLLCGVVIVLSAVVELSAIYHSEAPQILLDDPFARFMRLSGMFCGTLVLVFFQRVHGENADERPTDYQRLFAPMILLAVGGISFLACAYDLIALVVGAQMTLLPLYVLLSKSGKLAHARAAFAILTFAGALGAFGFVILYGFTGATDLIQVKVNLSLLFLMYQKIGPGIIIGSAMIIVSAVVMMGIPPFHLWLTEIPHDGSPGLRPVAIWLGVTVGAILLARTLMNSLAAFAGDLMAPLDWGQLALMLVTFTLVLCSAVLWREKDLGRLLMFVYIAQGGFLLADVFVVNEVGLRALMYHAAAYSVAMILTSAIYDRLRQEGNSSTVEDVRAWGRREPLLAGAFTVGLLSLGAAPLTTGFLARSLAVEASLKSEAWWLLAVTGVASLIVLSAILRTLYSVYQSPGTLQQRVPCQWNAAQTAVAILVAILLVYCGVHPGATEDITLAAARTFAF